MALHQQQGSTTVVRRLEDQHRQRLLRRAADEHYVHQAVWLAAIQAPRHGQQLALVRPDVGCRAGTIQWTRVLPLAADSAYVQIDLEERAGAWSHAPAHFLLLTLTSFEIDNRQFPNKVIYLFERFLKFKQVFMESGAVFCSCLNK